MTQFYLYLLILSVATVSLILGRRHVISLRQEKDQFKKEVAEKLDEYRQMEQDENKKRFRDEFMQQRKKSFDPRRYKEDLSHAEMAIAKKQWNEAKKYLIQAISVAQNELPASLHLANVYMESGDIKKAEMMYRRLMEMDAENPDIYESLGRILIQKKRYKEAIQAYVRAVELDERDDKKFMALGKLYYLLMRYSVAAECFRRAAELKPRDVEILFLLADACKNDEDHENALFTYERILTLEPYNEKAKSASQEVRVTIKQETL